jgi:hypothetical protein
MKRRRPARREIGIGVSRATHQADADQKTKVLHDVSACQTAKQS